MPGVGSEDLTTLRHLPSAQSDSSVDLNGESDTSVSDHSASRPGSKPEYTNMVPLVIALAELYEDNIAAKILRTAQEALSQNVS